MEHKKILNLWIKASNFKFMTRKLNIVDDQSNVNYDVVNDIIYNTEVLKSNLCNYNPHILVRGNITIIGSNLVTETPFRNCASFTNCITKIDGTTLDDAEDLDLVMPNNNAKQGAIDVNMDGSVLEEKSSFKMLGLTFSSKLDSGSYIMSIAKTVFKKIEALVCSMKFFFY